MERSFTRWNDEMKKVAELLFRKSKLWAQDRDDRRMMKVQNPLILYGNNDEEESPVSSLHENYGT